MITVLAPFYNQSQYVDFYVDKMRQQSTKDFEVIVLAATPFPDVVLPSNFLLLQYGEDPGLSSCYNDGIKEAKYPLVCDLPFDNWYSNSCLSLVSSLLDSYDVVYTDMNYVNSVVGLHSVVRLHGEQFVGLRQVPDYSYYDIFVHNHFNMGVSRFWRKDLGLMPTRQPDNTHDYEFFLNAALDNRTFYRLPIPLYYYRVHSKDSTPQHTRGLSILEQEANRIRERALRQGHD